MLRSINDLNNRQACYFITFNTVDWVDVFVRPVHKQVIVHTLNHFIDTKGLTVHAWCLMSSHLSLIAHAREGYTIEAIEQEYRTFTSAKVLEALDTEPAIRKEWMLKRFEHSGKNVDLPQDFYIWQTDLNPISIDLKNLSLTLEYFHLIHDKPVRDRCVDIASDYSYSSARDYAGLKGLVNVVKVADVEQHLAASESMNSNFFVKYIYG